MDYRNMKMQISAVALLLAGCAASPESYLAAHPETPARIAASIRQRDVVEGMNREQVRAAWGTPDSKPGWAEGESWCYQRSTHDSAQGLSTDWGTPFNNKTDSSQQRQSPFGTLAPSPKRMVYFRGEQVVLVEKAAGEL